MSKFVTQLCPNIMIGTLISSKTRIKILLKFFLNVQNASYLRGLESEFQDSSNAIRVELNRLEEAGFIQSELEGNKKMYRANTRHPLFQEIHNILRKHIGLDHIIENVIKRLGDVEAVYLAGSFAKGLDSPIIDLIIVGNVDKMYLLNLIEKAEAMVERKIRYLLYKPEEWNLDYRGEHAPRPLLIYGQPGSYIPDVEA